MALAWSRNTEHFVDIVALQEFSEVDLATADTSVTGNGSLRCQSCPSYEFRPGVNRTVHRVGSMGSTPFPQGAVSLLVLFFSVLSDYFFICRPISALGCARVLSLMMLRLRQHWRPAACLITWRTRCTSHCLLFKDPVRVIMCRRSSCLGCRKIL